MLERRERCQGGDDMKTKQGTGSECTARREGHGRHRRSIGTVRGQITKDLVSGRAVDHYFTGRQNNGH